MNKQTKPFLYLLIVIMLIAFSACGPAEGSEVAATETPTPMPGAAGDPGDVTDPEDDQSLPEDDQEVPEEDPDEAPSADNCLIGTWRADRDAFRQYLTQSMNVSDAAQFEFGEFEGDLEMVITQDVLSFRTSDPLRIPLTMVAGGVELLALDMVIEGSGDANWLTYKNYFIVYGPDYNFFGDGLADVISTDLAGQAEVRVNMTPELFVSMASFTNIDISQVLSSYPDIENYAVATYTCEGDVFTYQFGEYQAVWLRQ